MTKIVTTVVTPEGELRAQDHEIDNPKNFTVIVHQQGIKVDVPEFVEINSENTIQCMAEMSQRAWEWISTGQLFITLFKEAFQDPGVVIPTKIEVLNVMDKGVIHVTGMIVQGCEALFEGKSIFVRNPENYLHPKVERTIMDMFRKMMELCGVQGEVTTITREKPKRKSKKRKRAEKKLEQEDRKKTTIAWLQTMETTTKVLRIGSEVFTAGDLILAINNGQEVGQKVIELYFAKFGM